MDVEKVTYFSGAFYNLMELNDHGVGSILLILLIKTKHKKRKYGSLGITVRHPLFRGVQFLSSE
jgi:hypothetical protein